MISRGNFRINYGDKLKIKSIKFFILILIIFLASQKLTAQSYKIDYYGIVSTEIDSNMSKMTSDLYYTQLSEISNFSVQDKRTEAFLKEIPDSSIFSNSSLSFFTEIKKENNSDKWIVKLFVVDKANEEIHSKERKYDSYYKILMESKNDLKENIKQLIENDKGGSSTIVKNSSSNFETKALPLASTEALAGTWTGEDSLEKIVILRGGRGFVIFKNGASMNITVELSEDNQIIITQKGRGNASFYPELPRNTALNAALNAEPIQWVLSMNNNDSLSGIKNTLLPDGDTFTSGSVAIAWTRLN